MITVNVDLLLLYILVALFAGCIIAASQYSQRFLDRLKEVDAAFHARIGGTAKFYQFREHNKSTGYITGFLVRIPKDLPEDEKLRSLAYANQYVLRGLFGLWAVIIVVSFFVD